MESASFVFTLRSARPKSSSVFTLHSGSFPAFQVSSTVVHQLGIGFLGSNDASRQLQMLSRALNGHNAFLINHKYN